MKNFSHEEYSLRVKKTLDSMASKNIDTLLVADPANIYYLCGFDAWSFYMPQTMIISSKLDEPICFVRQMDVGGAYIQTYLKDENIIAYPEKLVHMPPRHPYEYLVEVIKDKKLDTGVIAVEMDAHYFTATCYSKLVDGLSNCKLIDSGFLVNWVRFIKSDKEIEYMHQAARNVEVGMQAAIDHINVGTRQCDAAAAIYGGLIKGMEGFGGDYPSIAPMLPTGQGTSAAHLTWSNELFKENEATVIEISGAYKRYHCPMARTVFLGKEDQEKLDVMNKTIEALEEGKAAIKAGVTADSVAQRFWKVLDKYNIKKDSRTGYSIGAGFPPDWGERTLNISKDDPTILETNCTFHMIAVMQMGNWGVEASDAIRVTDKGFEVLSDFSKELVFKN
ncbi:Xaa-Pro peptidase family protein [Pelagibacteraceae bacterium]|nr:Xaa-Pro peptidase family protein [Pelagibacteraceae bacterium]